MLRELIEGLEGRLRMVARQHGARPVPAHIPFNLLLVELKELERKLET